MHNAHLSLRQNNPTHPQAKKTSKAKKQSKMEVECAAALETETEQKKEAVTVLEVFYRSFQ